MALTWELIEIEQNGLLGNFPICTSSNKWFPDLELNVVSYHLKWFLHWSQHHIYITQNTFHYICSFKYLLIPFYNCGFKRYLILTIVCRFSYILFTKLMNIHNIIIKYTSSAHWNPSPQWLVISLENNLPHILVGNPFMEKQTQLHNMGNTQPPTIESFKYEDQLMDKWHRTLCLLTKMIYSDYKWDDG